MKAEVPAGEGVPSPMSFRPCGTTVDGGTPEVTIGWQELVDTLAGDPRVQRLYQSVFGEADARCSTDQGVVLLSGSTTLGPESMQATQRSSPSRREPSPARGRPHFVPALDLARIDDFRAINHRRPPPPPPEAHSHAQEQKAKPPPPPYAAATMPTLHATMDRLMSSGADTMPADGDGCLRNSCLMVAKAAAGGGLGGRPMQGSVRLGALG